MREQLICGINQVDAEDAQAELVENARPVITGSTYDKYLKTVATGRVHRRGRSLAELKRLYVSIYHHFTLLEIMSAHQYRSRLSAVCQSYKLMADRCMVDVNCVAEVLIANFAGSGYCLIYMALGRPSWIRTHRTLLACGITLSGPASARTLSASLRRWG